MKIKPGLKYSQIAAKSSRGVIAAFIQDTLKSIDSVITESHLNGFTIATYELPVTFGIANMTEKEVRFIVYSEVINQLVLPEEEGGKGFTDVKIKKTRNGNKIVVQWGASMDDDERAWRQELLQSYTEEQ